MRIALAGDHAGFEMKNEIAVWLRDWGHEVVDLGPAIFDPLDDYPDSAEALANAVASGRAERGVLVCGSGVGATVVANKVSGIRAGRCHDTYSARQGVEHDDMNVLCLGGRVIGVETARESVLAFLGAQYTGEERHARRLAKVKAIEAKHIGAATSAGA